MPHHPDQAFLDEHARLLSSNLRLLCGRELLDPAVPDQEAGTTLYQARFVVLSHGIGPDPCFTYANLAAQQLFEMPWSEIVGMPSRFSAEPLARGERQRLLERVSRHGYVDDYSGVRITRSGRRFRIHKATVWNLFDSEGRHCGQAACFDQWQPLE